MKSPLRFALNRMVAPHLSLPDFIQLAATLKCDAIEIRNVRSPTTERKGFLPMRTTRGDRLFIGLLAAAYINLAWVGLTDLDQWYAAAIGFVALLLIMRKG